MASTGIIVIFVHAIVVSRCLSKPRAVCYGRWSWPDPSGRAATRTSGTFRVTLIQRELIAVDDFRILIFIHFLKFSDFFTRFNNKYISVCYVKSLIFAMYIQVLTRASIYRTGGVRAISQFATQCTDALQLFSLRERIELFSPRTAVLSIVLMYCSSAVLPVRVVHTRTRTIFSRSVRALHDLLNCVLKFDCRSY